MRSLRCFCDAQLRVGEAQLPGVQSCPSPPCCSSSCSGRPQLLPRLRLLDADRLRLAGRAARAPGCVATSSRTRSRRPLSRSCSSSFSSFVPLALGGRREHLADLLLGRVDLLGLDDSRRARPRGAAPSRRRARPRGRASPRPCRRSAGRPPWRCPAAPASTGLLEQLVGARVDELVGQLDLRPRRRRRRAPPARTRARSCARRPRFRRVGDVLAQLRERVESGRRRTANSSSSSGSRLALTSVTVTSNDRRPCRRARPDSPPGT